MAHASAATAMPAPALACRPQGEMLQRLWRVTVPPGRRSPASHIAVPLQAVLDKADVVLLMDAELQAQQQAAAAAAADLSDTAQSDSAASTSGAEPPAARREQPLPAAAVAAAPGRPLRRTDTGLSGASSSASNSAVAALLARADPGSGGSLPPGIATPRTSLASGGQESPSAAAAAAAAAGAAASVYVSAAPSVQLEPGGSADVEADAEADADVAVLLELVAEDTVQLCILLPAAPDQEEEQEEGEGSDAELPPELAGGCSVPPAARCRCIVG